MIHSLTSTESYAFDYKRPMRAVALEPGFSRKSERCFVCGGMAGNLVLQRKGWLGWKEQILHSGEGPIWAIEWRGELIAWANDQGVKIYDTASNKQIGFVDRGVDPPRAELFKCSLTWKDDSTLVIGWADFIKIVKIRHRPPSQILSTGSDRYVEITAAYQVDCMISGICPYGSSYLILAYLAPDTYEREATENRAEQRRRAANRPELRIIDNGEEVAADALSLTNFHLYGCNDYVLMKSPKRGQQQYLALSPSDIVVVRPRDEADHVDWLVEQERYQDALDAGRKLSKKKNFTLDIKAIGLKYMQYLFDEG